MRLIAKLGNLATALRAVVYSCESLQPQYCSMLSHLRMTKRVPGGDPSITVPGPAANATPPCAQRGRSGPANGFRRHHTARRRRPTAWQSPSEKRYSLSQVIETKTLCCAHVSFLSLLHQHRRACLLRCHHPQPEHPPGLPDRVGKILHLARARPARPARCCKRSRSYVPSMPERDAAEFFRLGDAGEPHEILHRGLVGAAGLGVGQVGEPRDFRRHAGQAMKVCPSQQPAGRRDDDAGREDLGRGLAGGGVGHRRKFNIDRINHMLISIRLPSAD